MVQPKLIDKPYQEVVDDMLTAIVGGVVNEPHVFDIKIDRYALSEPADPVRGLRSVTGTSLGEHRTFQPEVDYRFVPGTDAAPAQIQWLLSAGVQPDHGSQFLVDYYRPGSPSPISDIYVGSVTRTLAEAFSREMAILYEQVNRVYLSAFIDTATGKSLDFVVAILGVERLTGEYAQGEVTFFRRTGTTGSITINAGVRLATAEGKPTFETSNLRTMQAGQNRINAPVRAMVPGAEGKVDANQIVLLLQNIEGIERVTNFDPIQQAAQDETDEDLRLRAKARLRGLNLCTIEAITQAALGARAEGLEIRDPQFPQDEPQKWTDPGTVLVLLKGDPARFEAVRGAIEGVRAAGIYAQVVSRQVIFKPRLLIKNVDPRVTPPGRVQIQKDLIAALRAYAAGVPSGQPISGQDLQTAVSRALNVPPNRLTDQVELRDVLVWLIDPNHPTQPTDRLPARELMVKDGQPVTDADILNWDFTIQTTVNGNPALPVVDMAAEDVAFL